jgi:hypothetical protein
MIFVALDDIPFPVIRELHDTWAQVSFDHYGVTDKAISTCQASYSNSVKTSESKIMIDPTTFQYRMGNNVIYTTRYLIRCVTEKNKISVISIGSIIHEDAEYFTDF